MARYLDTWAASWVPWSVGAHGGGGGCGCGGRACGRAWSCGAAGHGEWPRPGALAVCREPVVQPLSWPPCCFVVVVVVVQLLDEGVLRTLHIH